MAQTAFKGNRVNTFGNLPAVGSMTPDFDLVGTDLGDIRPDDFKGRRVILNIFPSLDTAVCAASVRRFNKEAAGLADTTVLCISKDLPFAHKRFCTTEGIENVVSASEFRTNNFGKSYGVMMTDGPLRGLLARSVVVLDKDGKVLHSELVPEITQEPDYSAALSVL